MWHLAALDVLAGGIPPGCQACGATWEFLRDSAVGAENVSMSCVPKDGILQLLCKPCCDAYVLKRADLYKGTPFGAALRM